MYGFTVSETTDLFSVVKGGKERPFSITEVISTATVALDRAVGTVWVEGEAVSVSRPPSGHVYFALSDGKSQLPAVMWRSDAQRLKFKLESGGVFRCRGRLGIYERDGRFQFYVTTAEPAGLGAEALALEQLKARLAAEGLFDEGRKKPLPWLPRRIGIATSKNGAAVRDIIRAVQRRFPVPMVVADCVVQGAEAPAAIVKAIGALDRHGVDLIIVGRGGGSDRDLSAFNDERVVRAIAGCSTPIISAVGHEVDISLADLVADWRAATPTMAGERAVPVLEDLAEGLRVIEQRLVRATQRVCDRQRQDVDRQVERLGHRMSIAIAERRRAHADLSRRLERCRPSVRLAEQRLLLQELEARMTQWMSRRLDRARGQLAPLAGRLQAMSPLGVLERGYAIATVEGRIVSDVQEVSVGDQLTVRLARGELDCRVKERRSP